MYKDRTASLYSACSGNEELPENSNTSDLDVN